MKIKYNGAIKASSDGNEDIVMYWDGQKVYEGSVDSDMTREIAWFLDDPEKLQEIVDYCNSFGDPVIEDTSDLMNVAATFVEMVGYELREAESIDDVYVSDEAGHFEIFEKSKEVTGAKKSVKAAYTYDYEVWVLDGDDNTWKVYKGTPFDNLGRSEEEFLDKINHVGWPRVQHEHNYIDVMVVKAGETPADYGRTETIKEYTDIEESKRINSSCGRKPIKSAVGGKKTVKAARKKYDTDKAISIFYESLENLNKFFKGTCMFRHTVGSVYMPDYAGYYEDDGYDFIKDLSELIKDNSSQAIMEWIEKYETNPLYLAVVNGTEDEYIQEHISGEDMNNIDPTVAEGFVDEWYNAFYNDCYKLGREVADSICSFLSYFSESVEEADGSYDYQNDFYEMQINYFGDKVISSVNRKAVKASRRAIMAGPGAGYTIKWNLESINNINSFNVTNVSEPDEYGLITVEADCDVDVTVEIVEAYSYYYGIDRPINNVAAKMTKVSFEIDPDQWPELGSFYDAGVDFAAEFLNNEIYDTISNGEVMYGGGWSHSTWDGTLTDYEHDGLIEIKVTDEETIEYVDDAVSGAFESDYDDTEDFDLEEY